MENDSFFFFGRTSFVCVWIVSLWSEFNVSASTVEAADMQVDGRTWQCHLGLFYTAVELQAPAEVPAPSNLNHLGRSLEEVFLSLVLYQQQI